MSTNAPTAPAAQQTLSQHFDVPAASLQALGLDPNRQTSEIDADTLFVIGQALEMNEPAAERTTFAWEATSSVDDNDDANVAGGAINVGGARGGRARRNALPLHGARGGLVRPPRPDRIGFAPERSEEVWVAPAHRHYRRTTWDELFPAPREQTSREVTFESWDRVEDWRRARGLYDGAPGSGGRVWQRVSAGESDEEELPEAQLSYEGRQAAESVGVRIGEPPVSRSRGAGRRT